MPYQRLELTDRRSMPPRPASPLPPGVTRQSSPGAGPSARP